MAAAWVSGVRIEDLLERDLAMQLLVEGDEDCAQTAAGVRAKGAEALTAGRRGTIGVVNDAVTGGLEGGGTEVLQGRGDVGIVQGGEFAADKRVGLKRGEAFLDRVVVAFEMPDDEGVEGRAVVVLEIPAVNEVVGEG